VTVAFDAQSFKDFTASDSWTHTPVAAPRMIWVGITQDVSAADLITAVTYGGVAMNRVTTAFDTVTEPGRVYMYWLAEPLSGAQTVAVTVASGTDAKWGVAVSVSANAKMREFGHAILNENAANPSRTFGTPTSFQGILFSSMHSGLAAPTDATIAPANSETKLTGTDTGGKDYGTACAVQGYRVASGADLVTGYTSLTDDLAFAAAAFQEEVGWFAPADDTFRSLLLSYIDAAGGGLYWALDDTDLATDLSGNGHDGTATGATIGGHIATFPPIDGEDPSCTNFDGTDDRVASTYNPFAAGSTRTFLGWATADALVNNDAIWSADGSSVPKVYVQGPTQDVVFESNGAGENWGVWPGADVWTFWALVFNDTTDVAELFLNAVSLGTQSTVTSYHATPGDFRVCDSGGLTWRGQQGHVAVVEAGLTVGQIEDLYAASGN
jgi:hypothetical protein